MKLEITKIGGDSACDITANVQRFLTAEDQSLLVISAIRSSSDDYSDLALVCDHDNEGNAKPGFNTTTHLIAIAASLEQGNIERALEILAAVESFTATIVKTEINKFDRSDKGILTRLEMVCEHFRDFIKCYDPNDNRTGIKKKGKDTLLTVMDKNELPGVEVLRTRSITGFGEVLVNHIYDAAFTVLGNDYHERLMLDTLEEGLDQQGDSNLGKELRLKKKIRDQVSKALEQKPKPKVIITGGYTPEVAVNRGYSELLAAQIAATLIEEVDSEVRFVVEKQYPIMSADPRKITDAQVITDLTYEAAKELFGAKYGADGAALMPEALEILARAKVEIVIQNPEQTNVGEFTQIRAFEPNPAGVEIVATKSAPNTIQVKSNQMNQPGIGAKITQWFTENKIPFDHSATTENTITYTFHNGYMNTQQARALQAMLDEVYGEKEFEITHRTDMSLLYAIGNNMNQPGVAERVAAGFTLAGVNLHMQTQGLSQHVMTYLVDKSDSQKALKALHAVCVKVDDEIFASTPPNERDRWLQEA